MALRLSDEARRIVAAFEEASGVTARDCLVREDRVLLVVPPEEVGRAIGTDGETVGRFEEAIGSPVRVVADADRPADFVANALAPAAVYDVAVEGETATVEVAPADRGVAIGADGRRIADAEALAERHVGVSEIVLAPE